MSEDDVNFKVLKGYAYLLTGDAKRDAACLAVAQRAANGESATCYSARKDDELDSAVDQGLHQQVCFADFRSLLECLWKGNIRLDRWIERGVRVELLDMGGLEADSWKRIVTVLAEEWSAWRRSKGRRQIAAATALCAAALLALAALFACTPA